MIPRQRIIFLDNLKILLAIVVIFVHAGQPYGPGGDWPINQPIELPFENFILIGLFFAVSASFFMGLFFFISSYFLPGSYERKGPRKFLKERLVRLGIPLLILTMTVLPGIGYFFYSPPGITFLQFYLQYTVFATGNLEYLSFGYLWFVVVLIILNLLYIGWMRTGFTLQKIPAPSGRVLILYAFLLGIASFLLRIWFPFDHWELFHAIEPAHLPQYLLLFAAGILASRNRWLEALHPSLARIWGAIIVIGIILLLPIVVTFGSGITAGGFTLASFVYSMWEAFVGVGMCITLVILFRDYLNAPGTIRGVLAQNVFPVYLIHLPVVLILQWLLVPVSIPTLAKFIVVGASGVALCFLISQLLVRRMPYAERIVF